MTTDLPVRMGLLGSGHSKRTEIPAYSWHMQDNVLGVLAILAGLVLCFRGYGALRFIIAIWGAFVGFSLGAGLVASIRGESFLGSPADWLVAIAAAVVCALLAYLYYAIAVIVVMASIGFMLGTTVMAALGIPWSWLVIIVGVVAGVIVAAIAIATNLPMLLLVVLSALAGASAIVGGVMLLVGTIGSADFSSASLAANLRSDWRWDVFYLVLVVAGVASQYRATNPHVGVRESWSAPRAEAQRGPTR